MRSLPCLGLPRMVASSHAWAAAALAILVATPLPTALASAAASPWVLPAGFTVIDNQTIEVPGDLIVPSGAVLSLKSSALVFSGTGPQTLRVDSGGMLIAVNTTLRAGGGPGHSFGFDGEPGSSVGLSGCRVEGAGSDVSDPALRGVHLAGYSIALLDCTIAGAPAGLVLDGAGPTTQVERVAFESVGTPIIALNGTHARLLDTSPASLAVEVNSTVCLDFTLSARFETAFHLSIPLVDFKVEDGGAALYATPGFGGTAPVIRDDLYGVQEAPSLRAPGRCVAAWGATTNHTLTLSARYGDWNETRSVQLAAPHTEVFHPAPRFTTFTNVTARAGVEGSARFDADTFGPGAAWGDFDRDGLLDLYVTDSAPLGVWVPRHEGPNHLYRNLGNGSFADVTNATGAAYNGSWGASWADYDNDGDLDLFITNYGDGSTFYGKGAKNVLFKNMLMETGKATFVDVTDAAGVADVGHHTSAAWGDYDNDGWLDLYVCNLGIMNHMTWWLRNESNVLYHNNRDGTFTDVTFTVGNVAGGNLVPGMGDPQQFIFVPVKYNGTRTDYTSEWVGGENRGDGPSGMSFAAAWFDADGDGALDLLVGNDHGLDAFYHNNGNGTFSDWTFKAGFDVIGSGMGFAVGDFDNDGHLDVYQSNFNLDYLWHNRGDGTFEEVSARAGLENTLVGWGTGFEDFNNDGWLDLFVDNGRVFMNASMMNTRPKPSSEPDRLYRNNGDGTFTEVSGTAGLDNDLNSMGAAFADYDKDGAVDIFVGNADGAEVLWHNNAQAEAPKSWLEVELVGTVSNRDGVGARVEVTAGGRTLTRTLVGGGSYLSSTPSVLHFGLGGAASVEAVDVYWPSGLHTQLRPVPINGTVVAKEEAPFLANAGPDFTVDEDVPVALDGSATAYAGPNLSFRRALNWSYEDGGRTVRLTGERPTTVFETPGVFTVTLTADDLAGDVATDTVRVTVRDTTAPSVALPADLTTDERTEVDLDLGSSTDNDPAFPAGARFSFEVVGAGGTSGFAGRSLAFVPPAPGLYLVRGIVTDAAGNRGEAKLRLHVRDLTPPTLEVAPARSVRAGELLDLAPLVLADNDPAFNATGTVTWSFAVGEDCRVPVTVYGRELVYLFETPGTYVVTVNATDGAGHSTLRTVTVVVEGGAGGPAGGAWPSTAAAGGAAAATAVAAAVAAVRWRRRKRGGAP